MASECVPRYYNIVLSCDIHMLMITLKFNELVKVILLYIAYTTLNKDFGTWLRLYHIAG